MKSGNFGYTLHQLAALLEKLGRIQSAQRRLLHGLTLQRALFVVAGLSSLIIQRSKLTGMHQQCHALLLYQWLLDRDVILVLGARTVWLCDQAIILTCSPHVTPGHGLHHSLQRPGLVLAKT